MGLLYISGCFRKDQVYLDGILKILRHRERINFQLLMSLGKVCNGVYLMCQTRTRRHSKSRFIRLPNRLTR